MSRTDAVPEERTSTTLSRLALAAVMVAAGVTHFVSPEPYMRIVPRVLPGPRALVYASGVAELVAAGLLGNARTRRLGGWWTAGLLVAVFPANVQMALDGGLSGAGGLLGSAVVAWLRLPLQLPLIGWAYSLTRPLAPQQPGGDQHGRHNRRPERP
ncbi:MAG: DoxX family protein [Egibacteraceae bacterium]